MLSIANNTSALQHLSSFNRTQDQLKSSLQKLSSGLQIDPAADDPSGLAVSDGSIIQKNRQQNVAVNGATAQLAVGTLNSDLEILTRIKSLAAQASSNTIDASARENFQAEFNGLANQIDNNSNTQFNGQKLFDGSFSTQLQVSPNSGDTLSLALGNVSSTALGLSAVDISTSDNAGKALDSIDAAIGNVADQLANAASFRKGLNKLGASLNVAASSGIPDVGTASSDANVQNQDVVVKKIEPTKLYQSIQNQQNLAALISLSA